MQFPMASAATGKVYLIPTFIDEQNLQTIPAYIVDAVKECNCFFSNSGLLYVLMQKLTHNFSDTINKS